MKRNTIPRPICSNCTIREEKVFFSTVQLILPEKMSKTLVRMKIKS